MVYSESTKSHFFYLPDVDSFPDNFWDYASPGGSELFLRRSSLQDLYITEPALPGPAQLKFEADPVWLVPMPYLYWFSSHRFFCVWDFDVATVNSGNDIALNSPDLIFIWRVERAEDFDCQVPKNFRVQFFSLFQHGGTGEFGHLADFSKIPDFHFQGQPPHV